MNTQFNILFFKLKLVIIKYAFLHIYAYVDMYEKKKHFKILIAIIKSIT